MESQDLSPGYSRFISHVVIMKLKKKEFVSLTRGGMSVSEYRDHFTQLSHYAPEEVDTDEKRQEQFLKGLIIPLNYQLQS
jgi:hypothetical protein